MHHCALREGQTGICRARKMTDGRIVSLNYGRITAMALDPVEKKPLNRFFPGSNILSVGSFGCNLRCPFCQNHEISMHGEEIPAEQMSPEALVELAVSLAVKGNIGVAYTYNEPLIGYEYVRDTARLVRRAGMKKCCSDEWLYRSGYSGGAAAGPGCTEYRSERIYRQVLSKTRR